MNGLYAVPDLQAEVREDLIDLGVGFLRRLIPDSGGDVVETRDGLSGVRCTLDALGIGLDRYGLDGVLTHD